MGSAISFVLSYIMYKEWREDERIIKFNERRELWIEEHRMFVEQKLMGAEDKK